MIIDGKKIAAQIKDICKEIVVCGRASGLRMPHLAVLRIRGDEASAAYVRGEMKDVGYIGGSFNDFTFPATTDGLTSMRDFIKMVNQSKSVDGAIIQLPLPGVGKDAQERLSNMLAPEKDLDGLVPNSHFRPCTPHGILMLLDSVYGDIFVGNHYTVIGRSKLIGKPMADMLLERNATVSVCHSKTSHDTLKALLHQSDVVISAVGRPGILNEENLPRVNPPIIVDVGTTMVDSKLRGDFRTDALAASGKLENFDYTPVPGGVGPMTRAALMVHLVQAWLDGQSVKPTIPEDLKKKFQRLLDI